MNAPDFKIVSTRLFDAAVAAFAVTDQHEFLESRYLDSNGKIIAKVVRHENKDGALLAEADLMISTDLGKRPP
ncbi:MAG: hypothetical protein OSB45_00230 [Pseudomonadales bacterium]|jgi:hypothetical protein|nr:hypothetical protein [Pseudomonadales bacterium]